MGHEVDKIISAQLCEDNPLSDIGNKLENN